MAGRIANPAACLAHAQSTLAASVAELDAELAGAVAAGDIDPAQVAAYEAAKAVTGDALAVVAKLDPAGDRFHRILSDVKESVSTGALLDMTARRVADIRALIA